MAVPATPSGGFSLKQILKKHEEQLMDFDKNICLLCKRSFGNKDQIQRHLSLSRLHSSRLKKLRLRLFNEEQLDKIERKEREARYRDRAKERRLRHGPEDIMMPTEPKQEISPRNEPLIKSKSDNKGAALMNKMGWTEGLGLGKSNEGITDIIKLDSQIGYSGLGSKVKGLEHLSYKEAVKRVMYQRYRDLTETEDNEAEQ